MELSQQTLDFIFSHLRRIHKSHWRAPNLALVQSEITRTGHFVFRIGSNPWLAEIRISRTNIDYVINSSLPTTMKTRVEDFKTNFQRSISSL